MFILTSEARAGVLERGVVRRLHEEAMFEASFLRKSRCMAGRCGERWGCLGD